MPDNYDLIVCGGGLTGVAAAIAASRNGLKKVLLIERYGFLGGMATAALVAPFMSFYKSFSKETEENQLVFGIFQELLERMKELDGAEKREVWYFDAEVMKLVLNQMVEEAGVEILFHSFVTDVVMIDEGLVSGITIANKSGLYTINCKQVIDATGDADIAYRAGVPCKKGREGDGYSQPMTLCFRLAGVDTDGIPPSSEINKLYQEAKERGEINNPREDILYFKMLQGGVVHFNSTRIVKKDATDAEDMSRAELEARGQVWELYYFLRDNIPAFKNSYLQITAAQTGVRESRRIVGKYILTEDDVLSGRRFTDSIAYCAYMVDIHNPTGTGTEMKHLAKGDYYGIPYRCLISGEVKNLLVAGRPISTTHAAHSSVRIMPTCAAIGQAAGTAAALASKDGIFAVELDYQVLRQKLMLDGAIRENF